MGIDLEARREPSIIRPGKELEKSAYILPTEPTTLTLFRAFESNVEFLPRSIV